MFKYLRAAGASALILTVASLAHAQTPVPDQGQFAVGANAGVAVTPDDEVGSSAPVGVYGEYYFTPRLSLRPGIAYSAPQIGPESDTSMAHTRFSVDGVYNWERGRWHPFAGAGLAIHRQDIKEHDFQLAEGTTLGFDLLGGLEYFATRRVVVKGEVGYRPAESLDGWPDPSSLGASVGLKWYFDR